jgi:hypothetical protein
MSAYLYISKVCNVTSKARALVTSRLDSLHYNNVTTSHLLLKKHFLNITMGGILFKFVDDLYLYKIIYFFSF